MAGKSDTYGINSVMTVTSIIQNIEEQATSASVVDTAPNISILSPLTGALINGNFDVIFTATNIVENSSHGIPIDGYFSILLSLDGGVNYPNEIMVDYEVFADGTYTIPVDSTLFVPVQQSNETAKIKVMSQSNPDHFNFVTGIFTIDNM